MLPDGFRGAVVVIYEQIAGELPVVRGDTLQYRVPVGGILKVALPQPIARRIVVGYRPSPNAGLRAFPTCYEMRRRLRAGTAVGMCWLGEIDASNALPHEAFIVSQWQDIPGNDGERSRQLGHLPHSPLRRGRRARSRTKSHRFSSRRRTSSPTAGRRRRRRSSRDCRRELSIDHS